jgi:hypothetical protein
MVHEQGNIANFSFQEETMYQSHESRIKGNDDWGKALQGF